MSPSPHPVSQIKSQGSIQIQEVGKEATALDGRSNVLLLDWEGLLAAIFGVMK